MGTVNSGFVRRTAIMCACAIILAGGSLYAWKFLAPNSSQTKGVSGKIVWRARLFAKKATGGIPELKWSELWEMSRVPGGFGMENMFILGTSPAGAVTNAYISEEDQAVGKTLFDQKCSFCHGAQAVGGYGPALNRAGLKHGDSDLAMYTVLRDGVKKTSMVPPPISRKERWQVIGYLKSLMTRGADDGASQAKLHIHVSEDRLRAAGSKTDEWLTYSGSYAGHRYTPLSEINKSNVSKLRVRWVQQFNNTDPTVEATPLVVDGTIFTTQPPSNLAALDARTGKEIWRYDYPIRPDTLACCGRYNRGVAILGQRVFMNSLDAHLVALDANTGKVLWDTQVGDNTKGYAMTGAPLVAGQAVVVGVSNGDLGIRGFVAAYDASTGHELWKFYTTAGPGDPGHATWTDDSWKTGGGATWAPGGYDPELDLLYWGVGNPAPDYSGDTRGGDNLYSESVIALHLDTGKLAWYFQFTPHDEHDWDSTQTPILAEIPIKGVTRKVICWANRNGFYYVIDRATGEFLVGAPFVEQTWSKGLDAKGRPILADAGSNSGQLVKPAFSGGTNWQNAALDAKRGLVFVHAAEGSSIFTKSPEGGKWKAPEPGQPFLASGVATPGPLNNVVRALNAATGTKKWEHYAPPKLEPTYSGLLATGGGLVFGAEGGEAFALDSDTGRELWRVHLAGASQAAPISFTLDGKQVLIISAGRAMFMFGL